MIRLVLPLIKFPDGRWIDPGLIRLIGVRPDCPTPGKWSVRVRFHNSDRWLSEGMDTQDQAVQMADGIAKRVNDARANTHHRP